MSDIPPPVKPLDYTINSNQKDRVLKFIAVNSINDGFVCYKYIKNMNVETYLYYNVSTEEVFSTHEKISGDNVYSMF